MLDVILFRDSEVGLEMALQPIDIDNPLPALTERQASAVVFIHDYFQKNSFYPTYREIGEAMGLTGRNPGPYLDAIEKKGLIKREAVSRRGIRLMPLALKWLSYHRLGSQPELPIGQ